MAEKEKMRFETPDGAQANIGKIRALFPECVTETRGPDGRPAQAVDFDRLRLLLSPDPETDAGGERYEFTWVGKKAAAAEANRPIRKTLRPCPGESKNWDATGNLYIEGDNLDVLKLLQESCLGRVKMIYIDPPYNTGNDFIYRDDFSSSAEEYAGESGEFDGEGNRLFRNTDSNGRFHSDWCSMIYSRLLLARNLLSGDGVIFISIDDNEVHNLRKICDEIFGETNFVGQTVRVSSPTQNIAKYISIMHDYTLVYCKIKDANDGNWKVKKNYAEEFEKRAGALLKQGLSEEDIASELRALTRYPRFFDFDHYTMCDSKGVFQLVSMGGVEKGNIKTKIVHPITKKNCSMPQGGWRYNEETLTQLIKNNEIFYGKDENYIPRKKLYLHDYLQQIPKGVNFYDTQSDVRFLKENNLPFDFPKPMEYISQFMKMINVSKDDIVLDFFSGSATTAHAVMQLNAEDGGKRKFIMVQLPEACDEKSEAFRAGYKNICEIGKERIRRAGAQIEEEAGKRGAEAPDTGFRVLKLDDSNMKDVYYSPEEYGQDLLSKLEKNIKEDRTALDLLFGCLIEWGMPLSLPHTSEEFGGRTLHTYDGGDLIACFDEDVPEGVVREIARRKPLRAVFRDSGFADSPGKINVFEIFKLLAPDTEVKVV